MLTYASNQESKTEGCTNCSEVVKEFMKLTRSTKWQHVDSIKMGFFSYHPQGLLILDDHIYFSSVDIFGDLQHKERYDAFSKMPEPNAGTGYVFKTDMQGNLIEKIKLGNDTVYHPGGMDFFDSEYIWVPVSEYRPDSKAIIYKVNLETLKSESIFTVDDHIGALAYNSEKNILYGMNWGSRKIYEWQLDDNFQPISQKYTLNPDNYIDYQDCHFQKDHYMICGGVAKYKFPLNNTFAFGGLDLIDLENTNIAWQVPVALWLDQNLVMTNDPFFVRNVDKQLEFYFMPEDGLSVVHVYRTTNTTDL